MSIDAIQAAIAAAAQQAPNMNEATKGGGGDYTPPKAGNCIVTLVGYIELGIQHVPASKTDPIKFPAKDEEQVELVFEVSGKGHEPKEVDGKLYPERIGFTVKKSLNEKAWFYRIFKALNYDGTATHFAQLIGRHYLATIVHTKGAGDKVWVGFKNKDTGYTFRAPMYQPDPLGDPDKLLPFPKPEVISEPRVFLWDYASKQMWDSIYIDGEYAERKDDKGNVTQPAKSKNKFQLKIKAAKNWQGSPMQELLGDGELDLDQMQGDALEQSQKPAEQPATQTSQQSADDALSDLLG